MLTFSMHPIGFGRSPRLDPIDDDWGPVVSRVAVEPGARRPRNNPDWPAVGVFAQRNKRRPNRIGVSTCELTNVDGTELAVRGLDAIDGTPVLDIKPYTQRERPSGSPAR